MQNLRDALEKLDEALDGLEDHAARRAAAPAPANTIKLRQPADINRTELIRLLDATISDAQNMLEQAA